MNTIPTKPRIFLSDKLRAAYLKWRLDHLETDIIVHEHNAQLARDEAAEVRVELARMGQL
jgi:hypothetical protein